jgi:hypothetical protein
MTAELTPQQEKNKKTNMKLFKWGCIPLIGILAIFGIVGKLTKPSAEDVAEQKAALQYVVDSTRIATERAQVAADIKQRADWEALPKKTRDSILAFNKKDSLRKWDEAEKAGREARIASENADKESNPLNYLKVKNWTWEKSGFGHVGLVNITFKNEGVKTARDVSFVVSFKGESGSVLTTANKTAAIVVAPGKSKSTGEINLGFIDEQTKNASIEITHATFE